MLWLWLFISGLILIIILLLIKIHLLRKSAQEIESSFSEKLITDSNTLIDISSNDKYMRHLANEINIQLRKLQAERRKFQKGDLELKNAVTNISHDLRTPLTAIYGYLDLLEQEEKSETVNRYIAVIRNIPAKVSPPPVLGYFCLIKAKNTTFLPIFALIFSIHFFRYRL